MARPREARADPNLEPSSNQFSLRYFKVVQLQRDRNTIAHEGPHSSAWSPKKLRGPSTFSKGFPPKFAKKAVLSHGSLNWTGSHQTDGKLLQLSGQGYL